MKNIKNDYIYSDKLRISVLDLSCIHLVTDEDKQYQLDYWAKLFKATTWEDLKMLAHNNEYMNQASSTIYQLSQEEQIRLQCRAREDYIRTQNDRIYLMAQKDSQLAEKIASIAEKDAQLTQKDAQLTQMDAQLAQMDAQLTQKDAQLTQKDAKIAELESQIIELSTQIKSILASSAN